MGEVSPLVGAEMLDEVEWLLAGGTHPLLIAQMLHRSMGSIARAARVAGRPDVSARFDRHYNDWLGFEMNTPRRA